MGRHAQGWKLARRRDSEYHYVYFHHRGRRYLESTGERDVGAAKAQAARIYAEVVSGRREKLEGPKAKVAAQALDVLFAEWLVSLESELSAESVKNYRMYIEAHFVPFFGSLERITTAYARACATCCAGRC